MVKISVIVPIYKVGKYIENSMKSIIAQRYKDFEVLLVDNNTPDDSIMRAEKILKPSGIEYRILKQTIQGLPAARNMGISEASGEWLISIDPDDTISSYFLEELYNCAIKNNLDVVFSKYAEVSEHDLFIFPEEKNKDTIEIINKELVIHRLLTRKMPLMVSNMFIRKTYFLDTGLHFDQDVLLGADLLLLWQLMIKTDKIGYINKYLYNHFLRADSLMSAPSNIKINSNLSGYKRAMPFIEKNHSKQLSEWVYAREVFALLSTLCSFHKKEMFKTNVRLHFSRDEYRSLRNFPDKKIRFLNHILYFCPALFYFINKLFRSVGSKIWKHIAFRLHNF